MVIAVILAGGNGSRMMNTSTPKQFIKLGSLSLLEHTVEKFLYCPGIDVVVIVTHSAWLPHTQNILNSPQFKNVLVCEGGKTRQESLYYALKFIQKTIPNSEESIIISHDAVRPFVSFRIIEDNIRLAQKYDAVDTVLAATDTIVTSIDGSTVQSVPNRQSMYQGQTPQTFRLKTYVSIYEALEDNYLQTVTDAARILVENGCTVGLVHGEPFNIKITNDFDLHVAHFLLGLKHD